MSRSTKDNLERTILTVTFTGVLLILFEYFPYFVTGTFITLGTWKIWDLSKKPKRSWF